MNNSMEEIERLYFEYDRSPSHPEGYGWMLLNGEVSHSCAGELLRPLNNPADDCEITIVRGRVRVKCTRCGGWWAQ